MPLGVWKESIAFNNLAPVLLGMADALLSDMMFTSKRHYSSFSAVCGVAVGLLALSGVAAAQNSTGQANSGQDRNSSAQERDERFNRYAPAHLRVNAGTYITVRVNQWLSSDRNRAGEPFAAGLAQPVIVDGVVVAQRGQTVGGRISEAKKAGMVKGTSSLGLQLIDLTLADGQVIPIQSELISRDGRTSAGRDAGAVAATTGLGGIIGAGAGAGSGAAIGAGAGAAAGIIGVLLTRGEPTIVPPESVLTFRISSPIEISTERAPQAFRYADAYDYERAAPEPARRPQAAYAPRAPYDPHYDDPYYYGRPYYRPGFSVYVGPRYGYGYGWGHRSGYSRAHRR